MREFTGEGGTAVIARPVHAGYPLQEEEDWNIVTRRNARVVSALIRDSVGVGSAAIEGEVEPRHDARYERHTLTLTRHDGKMTNANDFEFFSSLDWPGPLVAFLAHDATGKAIARCDLTTPRQIPADTRIEAKSISVTFRPIEPRNG